MLKRWEKADEDIPLLIEAKAMRERLAGRARVHPGELRNVRRGIRSCAAIAPPTS